VVRAPIAAAALATPELARQLELVLVRLAELGPPSEIRSRGPGVAAGALDFDRVLLSSITNGVLMAEALHMNSATKANELLTRLREQPAALDYPLIEGEIMRRRRAQRVRASNGLGRPAFAEVLGWKEYAVAPIVLDGGVIGFLHADREASGRELLDSDVTGLSTFAVCFALVYERAVLRQRLRIQRNEMRQVAHWADARTSELGDRAVTLAEGQVTQEPAAPARPSSAGESALRDLLTRRELEVLRLIVHGETNAGIAKELVLSEGTVKFHVKNILRKLHAANRAEATSRYLRLTLNQSARSS
jgi:LuxR family transcriptional regulator, regulator of acetate metabolism